MDTNGSDTLQSKLTTGDLLLTDFQTLKPGHSAELVSKLATGSLDQRENLVRLMSELSFARNLSAALNAMHPSDRKLVFQTVGLVPESEVEQVRCTLSASLARMVPSSLYEALREVIVSRDNASLKEVNHYLETSPVVASGFIKSLTSDTEVDDTKLSQCLASISLCSYIMAIERLIEEPADDIREVFKRIGDAVYISQKEATRARLEKAINSLSENVRNDLLMKIISDSSGDQNRHVNNGQRLISEYLEQAGAEKIIQISEKISMPEQWREFVFQSMRNEEKMKLIYNYFESVDKKLLTEKSALEKTKNSMPRISVEISKDLIMVLTGDNTTLLSDIEKVASLGHIAKIIALSSDRKFLSHADDAEAVANIAYLYHYGTSRSNSDRQLARTQIGHALNNHTVKMLLELAPSELKDVLKVFMVPLADMRSIKGIIKKLSPYLSAKLARVVHMAAIEAAAEIKAGSWSGDVLKGLTISGKLGHSSSVKIGESKTIGGELSKSINSEISISWSPAALIEGGRIREGNQLTSELNGFMLDWILQLNSMSQNQKSIFLEELKDSVTLRLGA